MLSNPSLGICGPYLGQGFMYKPCKSKSCYPTFSEYKHVAWINLKFIKDVTNTMEINFLSHLSWFSLSSFNGPPMYRRCLVGRILSCNEVMQDKENKFCYGRKRQRTPWRTPVLCIKVQPFTSIQLYIYVIREYSLQLLSH